MTPVNLVLSGGGARGIAHLGVIKALMESGLVINAISGVSAGAICGAFHAAGYSPEDTLKIVKESKLLYLLRPSFNDGLFKSDKIGEVLRKYLAKSTFESLNIPLYVSASDISEGHTDFFSQGDLIVPLLASSALPVIFQPVTLDRDQLVDGGILNNLPVEPFLEDDYTLVGVHVNPWANGVKAESAYSVMERSIQLSIYGTVLTRKHHCDLFLEPEELKNYSMYDLDHADKLFEIGYLFAKERLNRFMASGHHCAR